VVAIDDRLGVVRRDFRQLLGPRIRSLVHDGAPGAASVDPHQLRNALLNLVLNARAAIGESGRIVVESAADGPMVLSAWSLVLTGAARRSRPTPVNC
jgi:signal transduction histidine kinase